MAVARDILGQLALAWGLQQPGVVVADVQHVRGQAARSELHSSVGKSRLRMDFPVQC